MLNVDRSEGAEGWLPQSNGQQHSRPPDLARSPNLNLTPLQGDRMDDLNPGLKPWAESCNRFAVNPTDSCNPLRGRPDGLLGYNQVWVRVSVSVSKDCITMLG
jgi:hypothetical protein